VTPKGVNQGRVTLLLGDQTADQPDICRAIGGQSLLHSTPQLVPCAAEVEFVHHRQLTGDDRRDERRLVAKASIDSRLTNAGDPRHRLHAHAGEAVLGQERERGSGDRVVDGWVQGPGHRQ